MDFDEMVKRLQTAHLPTVARVSGKHYNQIWRLKIGKDKNPTTATVVSIGEALREIENGANNTPAK